VTDWLRQCLSYDPEPSASEDGAVKLRAIAKSALSSLSYKLLYIRSLWLLHSLDNLESSF
jgi:hypothetical protein